MRIPPYIRAYVEGLPDVSTLFEALEELAVSGKSATFTVTFKPTTPATGPDPRDPVEVDIDMLGLRSVSGSAQYWMLYIEGFRRHESGKLQNWIEDYQRRPLRIHFTVRDGRIDLLETPHLVIDAG